MLFRRSPLTVLLLAITGAASAQIHPFSSDGGMVVSDSKIASDVGAKILDQGGNAVDAAIATGFALAVTHPEAGNIGGGGFMVVRMANGEKLAIDFREMAPAAASRDMYLDENGDVVPRRSTVGRLAAGVPGAVAGYWEAHKKYGTMEWSDLLEPAVRLAAEGYVLTENRARIYRNRQSSFRQFPETFRTFNRSGNPYKEGDVFVQADLAKTLERIRDNGRDGFYAGETARLLEADAKKNGGLFTEEDLANYKAVLREPLVGSYRGHEVISMPPPSSGGIALLQMLGMLERFDLSEFEPESAPYIHLVVETMKRAFADRAEHLGDPDFSPVPVKSLLNGSYLAGLARGINPDKATPSSEISALKVSPQEGENTTHYSVVDQDGNAVSTTTTLNTSFGALVIPEGLGFFLNNEMDDFTSKPGVPNTYGLIQGEANSIAPGKRPLSSMTPTIVVKDGQTLLVTGSPGGPTIINTVMHSILNVVDHRMTVQQAVSVPRFHHQWLPDRIRWERFGISLETRTRLQELGHALEDNPRQMGSCHAILIEAATGKRRAGVDPRLRDSGAAASALRGAERVAR